MVKGQVVKGIEAIFFLKLKNYLLILNREEGRKEEGREGGREAGREGRRKEERDKHRLVVLLIW